MTTVFVVWFPGWHGVDSDRAKIFAVFDSQESAEEYIRESPEALLEIAEVPHE